MPTFVPQLCFIAMQENDRFHFDAAFGAQ